MALFNDGPISSLEDLRVYETSLLDTASIEGVSLSNKLELAQQELASEVLRFLIQQLEPTESVTPGKLAQVVATEPLRRWHALRTLTAFFRDVHHNQLNDRYRAKWVAYEAEAKSAARLLWEVGVGLVRNPLGRPTPPDLTTQVSDDEFPQLLFRTSWVTASGEESASSEPLLFVGGMGAQPRLTVHNPPARVTGWHVYAGPTPSELMRQTSTAILPGDAWVMPANILVTGPEPSFGQVPDLYVRLQRLLLRG